MERSSSAVCGAARRRTKSCLISLGSVLTVVLLYASFNTAVSWHDGAEKNYVGIISYPADTFPEVSSPLPPATATVSSNGAQPVRTCPAQRNIMFLKTHKCASSTVQNLLMRYGDAHNLTFVLPPDGNYLGHPAKFTPNLSLPLPSMFSKTEYNLFCHHTRWNENATVQLMPKDTVFVSIVKEPAAMFESMYNYVRLPERYKVSLKKFLEAPHKYYFNSTVRDFARNPMMFDFGLDMEDFENSKKIIEKIQEIDRRFALVMIAEHMEESLVLLRQLLCWSWDDVVVFRLNARKAQYKEKLSTNLQERARKWNRADSALYEYLLQKFHDHRKNYGIEKLGQDVETLREVTRSWYEFCVQAEISKNDTTDLRFQVWHPAVSGFRLSAAGLRNATCIRLAMAENPFTDALRMKLWPVQTTLMLQRRGGVSDNTAKIIARTKTEFW
ncbi:galactose-3-O-sulfotransferase 2-like [Paramacrobiotus metropolitanus]|uniref:galactose-3-O-sulfotransferase 2-like n=1 Tax=Paramacrobiotus metropolitanus TaxID=2943436 RepID=UPI002445D1BF|nr:galactose-3-O-sulfotransferase 2-like [Paramacrobiotus metropolitanus]